MECSSLGYRWTQWAALQPLIQATFDARQIESLCDGLLGCAVGVDLAEVAVQLHELVPLTEERLGRLLKLALHEDLTSTVVRVLPDGDRDLERALWPIAKALTGSFGFHSAVAYLGRTKIPEIRAWLLFECVQGSLFPEYDAAVCADATGLVDLLVGPVDERLLSAASRIVEGLARAVSDGISFEGVDRGMLLLERYLSAVGSAKTWSVDEAIALGVVSDWLSSEPAPDGDPWELCKLQRLETVVQGLRDSPRWAGVISAALGDGLSGLDDWRVRHAASVVQYPIRALLMPRLDAHDGTKWCAACEGASAEEMEEIARIACFRLPPDPYGEGMTEQHMILGADGPDLGTAKFAVLQEIRRYPGVGIAFAEQCLFDVSRTVRHGALLVFEAWPRESWGPDTARLLAAYLELEPESDLRERAARLR